MKKSFLAIKQEVENCCTRCGRNPSDVKIVAVSKTVSAEIAARAIAAGVEILGENRVNDAAKKIQQIEQAAIWHLIGHLQTNKVRKAIGLFDLIQSVDSIRLVEKIQQECIKSGRAIDVLLQVNTSGEESKSGFHPNETFNAVQAIRSFDAIKIRGLMTIGALTEDEGRIRACFRLLKSQFDEIAAMHLPGIEMKYLSMGMSNDFSIAIEEGSTMIRIGRALFQGIS